MCSSEGRPLFHRNVAGPDKDVFMISEKIRYLFSFPPTDFFIDIEHEASKRSSIAEVGLLSETDPIATHSAILLSLAASCSISMQKSAKQRYRIFLEIIKAC